MCDRWVNAGVGAVVCGYFLVEVEVSLMGESGDGKGRECLEYGY